MKIKLKANCFVDGEARKSGDVVEVTNPNLLLGMGKAEVFVEPKPKPVAKKTPQKQTKKAK